MTERVRHAVRQQAPQDDEAVVGLINEAHPEFPSETVEGYRAHLEGLPAGVRVDRFVTEIGGRVVGAVNLLNKFWVADPRAYIGRVVVHKAFRAQGIGGALFERALQHLQVLDAATWSCEVREDDPGALGFARHRGFKETGAVERNARLDPRRANLEGYDALEERLAKDGISVQSVAELDADEELLRQVYQVDLITALDVPNSDKFDPPFERWLDLFINLPGHSLESSFIAMKDALPIGFTALGKEGGNNAWSHGLGVLPAFRGKGVARLLKKRAIEWAVANDIEGLYTGNDLDNKAMIAINTALGYEPLPNMVEVSKDLTQR